MTEAVRGDQSLTFTIGQDWKEFCLKIAERLRAEAESGKLYPHEVAATLQLAKTVGIDVTFVIMRSKLTFPWVTKSTEMTSMLDSWLKSGMQLEGEEVRFFCEALAHAFDSAAKRGCIT